MKVRGLALFLNGCSRFRLEREQRVFSKWSRGSFEQRKARQLKRAKRESLTCRSKGRAFQRQRMKTLFRLVGNGFNQRSAAVNFDQSHFLWSGFSVLAARKSLDRGQAGV